MAAGVTTILDKFEPPGIHVYCAAPEALSVEEVFVPAAQILAGLAVMVAGGGNDKRKTLLIGLHIPRGDMVME